MNNGSNTWGVDFHRIVWFERLLSSHRNITNIIRHDDIVFEVNRLKQKDHLKIICCHEYVMGITAVYRALNEFDSLNVIHVGGGWCSYTLEAKNFCLDSKIGLYVSNEISGALWKDEFWTYNQRDEDGNIRSYSRTG